jgi:hypothetical protein
LTRAALLFAFLPMLVLAGTISYTLTTSPEEVRFGRYNGFDVVDLARGVVVPDPGKPCLPEVPVTLCIPAGATVTGVKVMPLATMELGTYNIVPSQPAQPISKPGATWTAPDPAAYSSDATFPAVAGRAFSTGSAARFSLASASVCPFVYRPQSGLLFLTTRLEVTVSYEQSAPTRSLTQSQRDRAAAGLKTLVANPQDLARFSPPVALTDLPEIQYLIVTNDLLAPEFAPFVEYRTSRGLRTEIRTVEWISRNLEGRDLQEKTRNLIRDYFDTRGLSCVLLAGDNAQVPSRRIRLDVFDETGDIPTDLYYGDLEYTWDSNNNNVFGEMGDSVDLYADVIVGRAPVDRVSQVRNFIAKVRTYENDPATDYIKRSLLPSGWLWRSINYHGKFVCDSIANITPGGWDDVSMENPPGSAVVADSFNHGFAIFNPSGHGNSGGVYDENGTPIYLSSNAGSASNRRSYSITTSLACNPGDFETEDCAAEYSINCDSGGSIGVMMNSRYGWGTPPQMGPSEKLCVRFFDFLFNNQEYVMGVCHNRSREEYAGTARFNSLWRWCMTEFNLLGDPAIDVWTETPGRLAVTCADSILTGSQDLSVTVTRDGAPLGNATVCAWKGDEVFATGQTNGSGAVILPVHPASAGVLRLTATGHDNKADAKEIHVGAGAPEPCIAYVRSAIDDSGQPNPNGVLEPGESCILSMSVTNTGTGAAAGASVVIRSLSSHLTVTDSLADLGTIAAGDTATATGLALTTVPDITPGSSALMIAVVSSNEGQWELPFAVDIGYPGRTAADIDTGDCILSVTARGSIGFDNDGGRSGRGFRFPKSDTSSLNVASFCLGNSPAYMVDRFYNAGDSLDPDWQLAESLRTAFPAWTADEMLVGAFSDAGHPSPRGVSVTQRALGLAQPGLRDCAVLVYDAINNGGSALEGITAGIIADFDVKAGDGLHDLARTDQALGTAYMRNVLTDEKFCGVKLLYPQGSGHVTCIDHALYVYPDSGMSEDMKLRALGGALGSSSSDRPFNWSVAVGTGPFGRRQAAAGVRARGRAGLGFLHSFVYRDSGMVRHACRRHRACPRCVPGADHVGDGLAQPVRSLGPGSLQPARTRPGANRSL